MKLHSVVQACGVALLAVACADQPASPQTLAEKLAARGYEQGQKVGAIRRVNIDGWNTLDSSHVIIDAGPSRYFLVTLSFACSGVDFEQGLHFTTTPPGDLTTLDMIVVPQPGGAQHCPIKSINELHKLPAPPPAQPQALPPPQQT